MERLLEKDGVLICEAGTGVGKTLAYLVPALTSGRKVIISTKTKALQEQIAYRDLPLVQRALGTDVPVAVMKGLSNYLCRRRYREFVASEEALRPGVARDLELLGSWVRHTESGDLAELVTIAEQAPIRLKVASSSETRVGARCPDFDDCFVTSMKREAEAARIVVTNHHLFFADLALRGPHPGQVLPDYDAVLLDEAHHIEDVAGLFFGARVTRHQIERLALDVQRLLLRAKDGFTGSSLAVVQTVLEACGRLFTAPNLSRVGRTIVRPDDWEGELSRKYLDLDQALDDLGASSASHASALHDDHAAREGLENARGRCRSIRDALAEIIEGRAGRVTWVDVAEGKISLSSTPVDLSDILRERLFDAVPAVGLLSATLSTSADAKEGGFSYVRGRLGIGEHPGVEELKVTSPFDYEKNCILYLPTDLGDPRSAGFAEQSAQRVADLIELTGGGAFVLTTSLVSMRTIHRALCIRLPTRAIWVQGQKPKGALLSAFRSHGSAVLVATVSFWEGVDVPGHALRLVVLEKLPFSVPTDPVFQARSEALESSGKSSFAHLALPQAALNLKQGFGRLIRTRSDRGIVALLDARAVERGYGKRLLSVLPSARKTHDWHELEQSARALFPPGGVPAKARE